MKWHKDANLGCCFSREETAKAAVCDSTLSALRTSVRRHGATVTHLWRSGCCLMGQAAGLGQSTDWPTSPTVPDPLVLPTVRVPGPRKACEALSPHLGGGPTHRHPTRPALPKTCLIRKSP